MRKVLFAAAFCHRCGYKLLLSAAFPFSQRFFKGKWLQQTSFDRQKQSVYSTGAAIRFEVE
jgi:hypothetical protein